MFQENRQKGPLTLDATQRWLQAAYKELAAENAVGGFSDSLIPAFVKYPRGTQIQIAVTRAIVKLIFDSTPVPSSPSSLNAPATTDPGYPETLYLDHARLGTLRTDAADFTALYMLLMLFRQLAHSASVARKDDARVAVSQDELVAIKKEIWEIGPAHLGHCYMHSAKAPSTDGHEKADDAAKWREEIGNVVLQLTMRAGSARSRPHIPTSTIFTPTTSTPTSTAPLPSSSLPDPNLLKLATSWAETNLRADAPLSVLMKKRIRRVVEDTTVALLVPPATMPPKAGAAQDGSASGLEPLMPEIRHLAEKLKKLVAIHLNVYGALYAQPGFLEEQRPAAAGLPRCQ